MCFFNHIQATIVAARLYVNLFLKFHKETQKAFDIFETFKYSKLIFFTSYKLCTWISSYFSFYPVNVGVSQRSVLTTTQFILRINDLLSSTSYPIHNYLNDSIYMITLKDTFES